MLKRIFIYLIFLLVMTELILRLFACFYGQREKLGELPSDSYNIICLGDSFTYGWGVEPEFTYPKQLEKMLNEHRPYNRDYKVFNLGMPGSNSSQALKYLRHMLISGIRPDMVIVLTGANDRWNFADSNIYRFITLNPFYRLITRLKIYLSEMRTYKMIELILLNTRALSEEPAVDPLEHVTGDRAIDPEALEEMFDYNLKQMLILAKQYGVKIIIQSYPDEDPDGIDEKRSIAKDFSVPVIDNDSLFQERLKRAEMSDLFLYDNSHPNAEGYKIITENLYEVIKKELRKDGLS
ncbi:MAG: hypothetical protein HQ558_01620 [Candidatus Omnitrophica bacterium]|nr:hypothetical protein [Candidatus Omnitrophota bacterium]